MSRKLASQALDALLNSQNPAISKPTTKAAPKKKVSKKDQLPKTKTGLKKIKRELRYGHSVKRNKEAEEARVNPLDKLQSQMEKEEAIMEKNLNYYRTTQRVSKKELELRKKIQMLREKAKGDQTRKTGAEKDESDGEDF
ncbi:hypothetical protein BG004_005458 [Podila humilis]|nr:hypothetical protein BG004_005458 [Podila humilis]